MLSYRSLCGNQKRIPYANSLKDMDTISGYDLHKFRLPESCIRPKSLCTSVNQMKLSGSPHMTPVLYTVPDWT